MTGMLCDKIGLMIGFGVIGVLACQTKREYISEEELDLRLVMKMIAIWLVLICVSFLPSLYLVDKSEWIWPWNKKHKS
jgi:hypothetical protein